MSKGNLEPRSQERTTYYNNLSHAQRVRSAVEALNEVLRKIPKGVNVQLSILDMATVDGRRREILSAQISQEL